METYKMHVRLTMIRELLGTAPADPEVYSTYVGSLAPDALSKAEEVAAVGAAEVEEKSMTIFLRDEDGTPFVSDYQIKGFFKAACKALRYADEPKAKKLAAYKGKIDSNVHIFPERIHLHMPGPMGDCQRPLRASTAQGERVALARSEQAPRGTYIEFEIVCLSKEVQACLKDWLDYGKLYGLGQWRNSGKGRFEWEEIEP